MMTVGGFFANRSRRVSPPRIATSSSLTILTICWAGFSAWLTSAPRARSLTAATNSLTTGRATSASSSAIRISRAVASMSASDSRPLPRRFLNVSARRSESVANTWWSVLVRQVGRSAIGARQAVRSDVQGSRRLRAPRVPRAPPRRPARRPAGRPRAPGRRTRRPPAGPGSRRARSARRGRGRPGRGTRRTRTPGRSSTRTSRTVAASETPRAAPAPSARARQRRGPQPRARGRADRDHRLEPLRASTARPGRARRPPRPTPRYSPWVHARAARTGQPLHGQRAGRRRPSARPGRPRRRSPSTPSALGSTPTRRRVGSSCDARGDRRPPRPSHDGRVGPVGLAVEPGSHPPGQVAHEPGPPGRPGLRRGGAGVRLGQHLEQVERLRRRGAAPRRSSTVAGSSRSRVVAVSASSRCQRTSAARSSASSGSNPSRAATVPGDRLPGHAVVDAARPCRCRAAAPPP